MSKSGLHNDNSHRSRFSLIISPRLIAIHSPNPIFHQTTFQDSSTALSIALENDHREIGIMIYAYLNYGRLDISGPTSTI
uniref:Uncharacterized protein n=1 Tax=Caenorhabditis japonica TaxID=281687 RepID=A0A8R1E5Q5_CAEJA